MSRRASRRPFAARFSSDRDRRGRSGRAAVRLRDQSRVRRGHRTVGKAAPRRFPMPACRRPGAPRASGRPNIRGKLFNVEVTSFDGQLDAVKQRAAIDNMASAEMGFRRHPGLRHRHADGAGPEDDRRRNSGHRHGHADRPVDQIKVHSFLAPTTSSWGLGHPGPRRHARRQGQGDHDPGRARPYGRTGPRPRLRSPSSSSSRAWRCSTLPADWDVTKAAGSGRPPHQVSRRSTLRSSTTTNGAGGLQRHEGAEPDRHPDRRRRRHAPAIPAVAEAACSRQCAIRLAGSMAARSSRCPAVPRWRENGEGGIPEQWSPTGPSSQRPMPPECNGCKIIT